MRAKKSLGQNFLKNKSIVFDIIQIADLSLDDTVLEIGPGKGILTKVLLEKVQKVIAVEKDDLLFEFLQKQFSMEIESGKLELVHGDILEELAHLDFSRPSGYKVVANIPYNITGEILRKFLSAENQPQKVSSLLVSKRMVNQN
jgi:16S rRNA (adenine1518-N6/adenine1519-N6)-dimethyltransferase